MYAPATLNAKVKYSFETKAEESISQIVECCDLYKETPEREVQDTSCRQSGGVPQI